MHLADFIQKKITPLASYQPFLFFIAPVNGPSICPNNQILFFVSALQFKATKNFDCLLPV
jgi:hypothetical protein